jgi:hypothetical protein
MMNKDIEKKLKKLRERYTDDGASLARVDDDEKRLRELMTQKQFASNDLVRKNLEDAEQRILEINTLLAYDETLNLPENANKRYALFRTREVWEFIIGRFGGGKAIDAQIEQIEFDIESESER